MYVKNLRLYNFRNLADSSAYNFNAKLNVIRGANGQGKTNLVEALYVLSFAKSFRTNSLQELPRWKTGESSVFGLFCDGDHEFELGVSVVTGKKQLFKNGDKVNKIAEFLGSFCCVCFSPSDLQILKGAPSLRRAFLDRHIMFYHKGYVESLQNLLKALANKSALLKAGVTDGSQFEPWNLIIAEEAERIEKARGYFIETLESKAKEYLKILAPREGGLSLTLESQIKNLTKEEIILRLQEALPREIRQRTTLVGPQRDELAVKIGGIDVRAYASQGQTRSVMISLKLALIALLKEERGSSPTIVLDDVESELDASRVQALFNLVSELDAQVFITGTDCAWLEQRKEASNFLIDNGKMTEIANA